jgi:hypothetical protein
MWVMLNNSFLSIVAHRTRPDELLVRARLEGDIEAAFEAVGLPRPEVTFNADADYPYRTIARRRVVGELLAHTVEHIEYDNFKDSVREKDRHDSYFEVWSVMRLLQRIRQNLVGRGARLSWGVLPR